MRPPDRSICRERMLGFHRNPKRRRAGRVLLAMEIDEWLFGDKSPNAIGGRFPVLGEVAITI